MYETIGYIKFWEKDDFEEGCDPATSQTYTDGYMRFKADTISGIIENIKHWLGVSDDALSLDSCGDIGRLDISVLENSDEVIASTEDIAKWKRGEIELYSAIYTFTVYENKPVSLVNPGLCFERK